MGAFIPTNCSNVTVLKQALEMLNEYLKMSSKNILMEQVLLGKSGFKWPVTDFSSYLGD